MPEPSAPWWNSRDRRKPHRSLKVDPLAPHGAVVCTEQCDCPTLLPGGWAACRVNHTPPRHPGSCVCHHGTDLPWATATEYHGDGLSKNPVRRRAPLRDLLHKFKDDVEILQVHHVNHATVPIGSRRAR